MFHGFEGAGVWGWGPGGGPEVSGGPTLFPVFEGGDETVGAGGGGVGLAPVAGIGEDQADGGGDPDGGQGGDGGVDHRLVLAGGGVLVGGRRGEHTVVVS